MLTTTYTTVDKDVAITKHQKLCTWQKCVHAANSIHAALGQQITNAKLDKHSRYGPGIANYVSYKTS